MHGEPFYNDYHEGRVLSRRVDEFIGMARLLAAKPELEESDIRVLDRWLAVNRLVMDQPVVRPIMDLLWQGGRQELLSEDKLAKLHKKLRKLCGNGQMAGLADRHRSS